MHAVMDRLDDLPKPALIALSCARSLLARSVKFCRVKPPTRFIMLRIGALSLSKPINACVPRSSRRAGVP